MMALIPLRADGRAIRSCAFYEVWCGPSDVVLFRLMNPAIGYCAGRRRRASVIRSLSRDGMTAHTHTHQVNDVLKGFCFCGSQCFSSPRVFRFHRCWPMVCLFHYISMCVRHVLNGNKTDTIKNYIELMLCISLDSLLAKLIASPWDTDQSKYCH